MSKLKTLKKSTELDEVRQMADLPDNDLWKELRREVTIGWASFKRSCLILSLLKGRYVSDPKWGKTSKKRASAFIRAVYDEVGFSQSYTQQMLRAADCKDLMYMEDSVGSKISSSAVLLLAQKQVQNHPNYKKVLEDTKKRAVSKGEMVTYASVRSKIYPREEYRMQAKAHSSLGSLLYIPKRKGMSLKAICNDIHNMLEADAIYLNDPRKRVRKFIRKTRPV